jgi:hypothetical protein
MTNSILSALEAVHTHRHGSFALVIADSDKNYYAQWAAAGERGLYGEIVGNDYLHRGHRLTAAQQDELRARGWRGDGAENWSREWEDASTPPHRQRIALETLGALHEVYGAHGDIRVEVNLEGPSAKAATRSARDAGIAMSSTPNLTAALLAALALGFVLVLLLLLM